MFSKTTEQWVGLVHVQVEQAVKVQWKSCILLLIKGCKQHITTKSQSTKAICEKKFHLANRACVFYVFWKGSTFNQYWWVTYLHSSLWLNLLKLLGKMCSAFLAQESKHSAVCLSVQSKTKSPRAEAGSQTCTFSSLQADNQSQQSMNERAMYAGIMQHVSAPSSSH